MEEDDVFVHEFEEGCEGSKTDEIEAFSYLESLPNVWGGVGKKEEEKSLDFSEIGAVLGSGEKEKWVTVADEIRKTVSCNKTALKFIGRITGGSYYKFIHCYRWICEQCGSKHGRIHKKRLSRLLQRIILQIDKDTKRPCCERIEKLGDGNLDLRQTVLTVPMELRQYFMTRKDITALNKMAERLLNKIFHGKCSIRYFHGFGDKSEGVYNPHVNVHTFEPKKTILKLTIEEIQDMRYRWGLALGSYISQVLGVRVPDEILKKVDIHYSFIEGDKLYERRVWNKEEKCYKRIKIEGYKLIAHRIVYMSRPVPGFQHFDLIKKDEQLLRLFVIEMKGFHYISNCGTWKIKDGDRKEEAKEMKALAGEGLRIAKDESGHILYVSRAEFNMKYRESEYDELTDGFYKIKQVGKDLIKAEVKLKIEAEKLRIWHETKIEWNCLKEIKEKC
jgi:hypothetical protein